MERLRALKDLKWRVQYRPGPVEVLPSQIRSFLESVGDLISYSFVFDIRCKQRIFLLLQNRNSQRAFIFFEYSLCVKRSTVLEDTVTYLKKKQHNFSLQLKVKFSEEDGIDAGGVSAEFFTILGQDIIKASNLIQASEDSGLFWFCADVRVRMGQLLGPDSDSGPPESCYSEQMYYFGVICGLAFYNHCYINIGFPLALFKKLLNYSPTLRDLEEFSPVEARSLKALLMEDEDVLELLYLDFTVKGQELVPNGANIAVTKGNRQKYVDLYVDFVFNKSVKNQFGEFAKGFSHGSPFNFWKIYQPEELRELLYGTAEYKWEELQEVAKYVYCGPSDELIQNFWSVFLGLGEDHQKKFLSFMYGTDRLPIGGLSKLHLEIVRCDFDDSDNRFPAVQTCFGKLFLPNYSTIDVLREKLVHAIIYCEVFGQK